MSGRLLIVPDSDRVEQWLLSETRVRDFVDLRDVCTLSQLLERCDPAGWARKAPAPPLLVRMMYGRLAGAHAVQAFGLAAHTAEFAAQAQELVNHLRSQAVTPRRLEEAASEAEGSLRLRARALAALWRAVDAALAERGLIDSADWWRLATERVAREGLPGGLRGYSELVIRSVHDISPARLGLFEALARACTAAGVGFSWLWPASGSAETDAFVINTVRDVEARWQSLEVEIAPELSDAPLAWVGAAAFSDEVAPREAPELSAFCAPSVREEVREIARRVRRLVAAGVPPESIGVAYRDLADDTELLVEALADLGVPARARLGVPLAEAPHGRVALAVLQLVEDGFPADAVASLLESRIVRLLGAEAAEPRRAFREAGVRDALVGAQGERDAYAVRLGSLVGRSREGARGVKLLAEAVAQLISLCRSIPEQGSALELLEAWWDVLSKLGALATGAVTDAALDEAAVEALAGLLTSLRDSLERSGLSGQFMTRREFHRWVRLAAAEVNLAARGPRAGAVWLLDARELAGRQFAQLFLGGLLDGRFPGRSAPLALLSEEERTQLNRAAKYPLFRTSVGEGDVRLPARLAEDRLLFHFALSSAASVTVSRARFDDAGRELLASPFRDALARCVAGFREEPVHRSSVARLDEVQTEAELRVRAALEALSPEVTRQTAPDARREALTAALHREDWFQRAARKGAMEAERLRFFTDPSVESGPYSGRVDGAVLEALQQRLAFDAEHPVASHELGQWGTCAFLGVSTMVLGLEAGDVAGEELDSRTRGNFWHEALARLIPELDAAGLLGKDDPAIRARIERAIAEGAAKTAKTAATGHPALWTLAQEWAVTVIHRVVTSPEAKPFGLARPKYLEVPFGDPRAPAELRHVSIPGARRGERDVFLTGRMDRVDVGEGVVGVLDYKTSVRRSLGQDFLRREFQMAFYLLAVRSLLPEVTPTGGWLGLGRNELKPISSALPKDGSVDELLATDEVTRARLEKAGRPNLANAVFGVLGRIRSGDFGARPIDCEYCELKPVCRISQRQLPEERP
ncbi:MAG: PD-(D/E)XK nuclease family protein [Myxococcota bacterium]